MQITPSHRALAKKFMFQDIKEDIGMPDSLLKLVAFAYTEEEADIVTKLGLRPRTAKAVAKKARRPVGEVEPILKSLADRLLIASMSGKKGTEYGFMLLIPGVFEIQIMRSKGGADEYYKEFARLFEDFYTEIGDWLSPRLENRDLQVMRIVPIEQSLESVAGLNVIAFPTDRYSEMVDRNNSFCLLMCPCRHTAELIGKGCGKPKDVCSAMGWVADLVVEKGLGRRVSREEFLDAKMRAAEAGLVNMVDNMQDPLQVCSCCGCCCAGLRTINQHNMPAIITQSHFESVVDAEKCTGCGTCVEWCQVKAINLEGETATIDYARCIGCGVCVDKCDNEAISLRERKDYKPPADNVVDHVVNRYLEIKGHDKNALLPRVGLGAGRLLSKFVQHRVAGPDYKPSE